jgi:serine protease Do
MPSVLGVMKRPVGINRFNPQTAPHPVSASGGSARIIVPGWLADLSSSRRGRASMLRKSSSYLTRRTALAALTLCLSSVQPLQTSFAQGPSATRLTQTVRAIQSAEPAVVNIEGNKLSSKAAAGEPQQVNGMGSGVIIDPRGYILTNQHVVQDVTRIEVTLHDRSKYIARLVDRDPSTDLALIKIEPNRELPVIRFGTSSDLLRGERVIAIGNPFGYQHTVTEGIISALHRDIPVNGVQEYKDLIQTDASINPGNSGGPLLNIDGEMIGLNAAVRVGAQGIGFAIPVDKALDVAADLIAAHRKREVCMPFDVQCIHSAGRSEVRLQRLRTPAAQACGLEEGDRLLRIGKRDIHNRLEFELCLLELAPNSTVDVEIERNGHPTVASVATVSHATASTSLVSTKAAEDPLWQMLGLKVRTAEARQVQRIDASYNGGLVIIAVRENSPAHAAQLKSGDILVGLLDWQTPNSDDLNWILSSPEMKQNQQPKFRIIRGSEVFGGTMDLARNTRR